jgi:hypothetical protein
MAKWMLRITALLQFALAFYLFSEMPMKEPLSDAMHVGLQLKEQGKLSPDVSKCVGDFYDALFAARAERERIRTIAMDAFCLSGVILFGSSFALRRGKAPPA